VELDIAPGDTVEFTLVAKVSEKAVGEIKNVAKYEFVNNDGTPNEKESEASSKAANAKIEFKKISDTKEVIAGKDITYTVELENKGLGIANNIRVQDLILDIKTQSIFDEEITAFSSVVITDNSNELKPVSSIENYDPNDNLNITVDVAPGDIIKFTLVGTTRKLVKEDIINKAIYSFTNNDGTHNNGESETTTAVKLNEGQLQLTKRALKKDLMKGEVVEYEIIVRNTTDIYFTNVAIEDKIPAGFRYVEKTTEMTLSGDSQFGNNDDIDVSDEPLRGNTLGFTAVNIGPKEILRIRYLLRASIGTTFGKYVNTAHAVSGGKIVSNHDSASVEIIPDALFDTATIIGKVFEDINGDGYQEDATAKKILIQGNIDSSRYIPNTTTLEINGKIKRIEDRSTPLERGITIDKLYGISRNRNLNKNNKAIIRYETIDSQWEPLTITTKAGTHITIDKNGKATTHHTKDVKKGRSSENIKITRNIYRQKGTPNYLQEIVIENLGIYEDGIPGIRLITVNGVVIHTDEFGRYHVPDEWVTRKTGSNFIVKVDEDSLPQGMKVISENPRVKRISPNGLNKFNFSIQREEDDFEIKNSDSVKKIWGGEKDE
jgi:uncharacterized repeat protein (TIGR01451 family)